MEPLTSATAPPDRLIGRQRQWAALDSAFTAAREGAGSLWLLAGEAGVGKTRLAEESLAHSGLQVFKGAASENAMLPYGPIVSVLRSFLRAAPNGFNELGPYAGYLGLLLPEFGDAQGETDRATLFESVRSAFEAIAHGAPTAIFLDDLQWADNATLELLPVLAGSLEKVPLIIVGVYRNDEIPRGHPVRRLRNDLRRARLLQEIEVKSLDREGTTELAARILGQAPGAQLAAILYDRSQGVPLFVEELANALRSGGRLFEGEAGLELKSGEDVPLPETIRDAMLIRLEGLDGHARKVLEVAAVAGTEFDLELVTAIAGSDAGFDELADRGLIVEAQAGMGAFRHDLTREAIYREIFWTRRRALHRQIAEFLEARVAPPEVVAEHWLAGREFDQAREALVASVGRSCGLHAYRDAANAAERALELWPEDRDEVDRLSVLDQLGHCAQLSGMLSEAARAWREVADGHLAAGSMREYAQVQRNLAAVYGLQGAWERSLAARQIAASTYAESGLHGEAATERLAIIGHIQGAGHLRDALERLALALEEAELAGRLDLQARALGLKGAILAKLGQIPAGRETVQAGLSLALKHNLTGPAAEIYQRLASVQEQTSDYAATRDAYQTAVNYCENQGESAMAQLCMACLAFVLRQTGDWKQAISLCEDVIASTEPSSLTHLVAAGLLGFLFACQGEVKRARNLLVETAARVRGNASAGMEIECAWGLAILNEIEGAEDAASERYRFILEFWQQTEDRHYAIPALRGAVTFFSAQGLEAETHACAEALARIATDSGNPEALAALAHALGEVALLNQEHEQAAQQFGQATAMLRQLDVPLELAETEFRAGVALAAAGDRAGGVDHLVNAYRIAQRLGARPLSAQITRQLADLGEPIGELLNPRAANRLKRGGLTRRQMEVLRLVALGRTNPEIARELFLSPRTVDMHVSNILSRLDCRSRAEAVRKAGELGLLD